MDGPVVQDPDFAFATDSPDIAHPTDGVPAAVQLEGADLAPVMFTVVGPLASPALVEGN